MKIKDLQIRNEMHLGDIVSIPLHDKFVIGYVIDVPNEGFVTLNINHHIMFHGEHEIHCGLNSEGRPAFIIKD